ncbi:MAG: electron transfer flavoprotein subunit beta/FixA family protein [Ignavibacteria bacterium]|nr:electron transfer flavoprotein subunit beta/FixA family protein [Ignavibacteria bacterium]
MNLIVFLKMVPDTVEELKIASDGKTLDPDWLRMKANENDEHAVEEAVILKEKYGGTVTLVTLDAPEVDEAIYTALAKGCDKAVKILGDWQNFTSPAIAEVFAKYLKENNLIDSKTLILTGSQATDDIEGELVYYLGEYLELPVYGVVTYVQYNENKNNILIRKEFSGGLRGEFEVELPAVLGIQAAENPPRYVPIAKIRAMMKSANIEELEFTQDFASKGIEIEKLYEPEVAGKAVMLEGNPEEIATKIVEILTDKGLI